MTEPRHCYCTKCGKGAYVLVTSIDPGHPIAICDRRDRFGNPVGCGRVIGTYDQDEAESVAYRAHAARLAANHERHIISGRPRKDCPTCTMAPPEPNVKPHAYEPIAARFRTFAHLELMHGDRTLMVRMSTRSPAELAEHHKALHEAGR